MLSFRDIKALDRQQTKRILKIDIKRELWSYCEIELLLLSFHVTFKTAFYWQREDEPSMVQTRATTHSVETFENTHQRIKRVSKGLAALKAGRQVQMAFQSNNAKTRNLWKCCHFPQLCITVGLIFITSVKYPAVKYPPVKYPGLSVLQKLQVSSMLAISMHLYICQKHSIKDAVSLE